MPSSATVPRIYRLVLPYPVRLALVELADRDGCSCADVVRRLILDEHRRGMPTIQFASAVNAQPEAGR
jgi:hypothetical protein